MEDVRMEDVVMYCEAGGGYTDGGCTVKQICLEHYWIPLTVGLADGHGGTDTRPGVWLCNKPTDLSACVSEECGNQGEVVKLTSEKRGSTGDVRTVSEK